MTESEHSGFHMTTDMEDFCYSQHVPVNTVAETLPGSYNRFLLVSAKAVRVFSPSGNLMGTITKLKLKAFLNI